MLSYLRRHHIGLLALFIALSGTTYAAATGSINSREIRNGTIVSKDVRDNRLGGADLKNGTVRSREVKDGGLIGADVLDASLNGADVATGSLEGSDLRDGTVRDADIGGNSISADEIVGGAVRSDEVQNGSLQAVDFAGGALGSDAGVRFDTFAVAANATGSDAVACAAGERALGGGVSFATDDAEDRVTFSEPRNGGAQPGSQGAAANGWAGGIFNGDGSQRTATVWAICASR